MDDYIKDIEPIPLSRARRKEQDAKCTLEELRLLQGLAGKLNYVGHGILPPAALVASQLQQKVGDLRVKHLCMGNNALRLVKKLKPSLYYIAPPTGFTSAPSTATLVAFSDASTGTTSYG